MSDDLDPTVEEAVESPEVQETPEATEDVGALKRALEHEREERRQAKEQLRRLREDEDARREFLTELGYEISDDEPVADVEDEYDEAEYMTKAEFKAWQQERQAEQEAIRKQELSQRQFEEDFTKFVGDRELDPYAESLLRNGQYADPADLEATINGYFEHVESLGAKPRKRRTTPAIQGGQAATGVPNYGEMSRSDIDRLMVERVQAARSQT